MARLTGTHPDPRLPSNGEGALVGLWWWKDWSDGGTHYAVSLIEISPFQWRRLGRIDRAVVDDFGALVCVTDIDL